MCPRDVIKEKTESKVPKHVSSSIPPEKFSQQPAQGFGKTYRLPYPKPQFFVPYQIFNLFQNNEVVLSSPKLQSNVNIEDVGQVNDITINQQAELNEELPDQQDEIMVSPTHSSQGVEIENSDQSSNYDSAEDTDLPQPVIKPKTPVKRYPSRKRQVPRTFQYEEIVTKKPYKK